MSAIQNDRDALLIGTAVRFYPPTDRAVILGASAGSFRIPASGGGTPASITLTAVVLGMPGNVQWTASPDTVLTVNGNQAVLKLSDMADDSVVITASITRDGVTYQGRQTIYKMYDGRQGASTGLIQAYKRAAAAPTDNPGAVTFTFSQGKITTPAADALANGWTKSIPAGTDPLYVTVASASAAGDTDQVAAAEWSAPVMLAQNGISGLNAATVFLYRRTTTNVAPAKPTADVTYTFATGVATGLTGSWTQNVPAASGGGFLWVTTATAAATTATDTIAPAEWAAVQLMAQNGSDGFGYDGQRGTVDVVVAANYWPDDTTATQLFHDYSGYGYDGPYNRDRMTLTNSASGGTFSQTRFYDNGVWKTIAAWINGNMVVTGTFSASKISGGTISGVVVNLGPNAEFQINSSGITTAVGPIFSVASFGNLWNPDKPSISVGTSGGSFGKVCAVSVYNAGGQAGAHGVQAANTAFNTSGIIGMAGSYDFYADGGGTNYGPFTGAHDGLVPNDQVPEIGDLMVDVECVATRGYSNTLFTMERSSAAYQRGVRGPAVAIIGPLSEHAPAAMVDARHYFEDEEGQTKAQDLMHGNYYDLGAAHTLIAVNAVGEGSIKVCGQGGSIGPDDLLVASSIPGVGMRQNIGQIDTGPADDLVRGYTVAKARVAKGQLVTFPSSDAVLVIPCIYLGG